MPRQKWCLKRFLLVLLLACSFARAQPRPLTGDHPGSRPRIPGSRAGSFTGVTGEGITGGGGLVGSPAERGRLVLSTCPRCNLEIGPGQEAKSHALWHEKRSPAEVAPAPGSANTQGETTSPPPAPADPPRISGPTLVLSMVSVLTLVILTGVWRSRRG